MLQMKMFIQSPKGMKSDWLKIIDEKTNRVGRNELGCHGKNIFPPLDPFFGIPPMTLGRMRNLRQRRGLFRPGSANFHFTRRAAGRTGRFFPVR
jgi:hypothetical protein